MFTLVKPAHKNLSVREVLERCEIDFRHKERMCSTYFAIDKDGKKVEPEDRHAVAWCLFGIVFKHCQYANWEAKHYTKVAEIIKEEVKIVAGGSVAVTEANDFWMKSDRQDRIYQVIFQAVRTAKYLEATENLNF